MFKPAPIKLNISYNEFSKLDIRVGTILHIEDKPKSDKLVKETVDFGDHSSPILTGMKKKQDNPMEIEVLQTLFVLNIEPRKMMGKTSKGMILRTREVN